MLEAAGGLVVQAEDGVVTGDSLVYNKPDLTNPQFVAAASDELLWRG